MVMPMLMRGHAHGDEHPEKGLGGGGSQILCRFHQALIDLGHAGVEGQDHVRAL